MASSRSSHDVVLVLYPITFLCFPLHVLIAWHAYAFMQTHTHHIAKLLDEDSWDVGATSFI